MVSVEEASRTVFSNLFKGGAEAVSLNKAIGRVLAETVMADRDFPPFNRVAMDGIAIRHETWSNGQRAFQVESTQAAGEPARSLSHSDNCIEVMTGAVLPNGTDTVIRYEDLSINGSVAEIKLEIVPKGQNIHVQGADAKKDEVLLGPGIGLSPAEIALLASVGKSEVSVRSLPRITVISGGDELVSVNETPLPHQIRRSNVFALESALSQRGCYVKMFHLPDRLEILRNKIKELLSEFDVLILSGGVSKGKFDFIPQVLEEAGVEKKFHEVSQRPGKPFWFGASPEGKIVFALPGNPVSTFMCYFRYIQPWLIKSVGGENHESNAILDADFTFQPKLTYFLQVKVINSGGRLLATPVTGGGSGDFANLKDVSGFLELPLDKNNFLKGEVYPYIPFR